MSIMSHHKPRLEDAFLTRRDFLCKCGMGMGALGFASLMAQTGLLPTEARAGEAIYPLAPKAPLFPARAKRVIHIFLNGGPSHVDTFDPKPALEKYANKPLPTGNLPTELKNRAAFPSPFKFQKHGQRGIGGSEMVPRWADSIGDIC